MKTKFYLSLALIIIITCQAIAQQSANTTLSNLKATKVNQNLVPDTNNLRNLGSAKKAWKNIYVKNALYINNLKTISQDSSGNIFIGNGISNYTGSANTITGVYAFAGNSIGTYNTANGYEALASNFDGNYNTASGGFALYYNSGGSYNAAYGTYSLLNNTTGNNNNAVGHMALYSNTIGSNNNAIGFQSLYSNSIGNNNTGLGYQALFANTTGNQNIAMGNYALFTNTTGFRNISIGDSSLMNNTSASDNIAIGVRAMQANSTGYQNTAIGSLAFFNNSTGYSNTSIGASSLYSNTTGTYNVAIGVNSLYYNTTGYGNTTIGAGSWNAYPNAAYQIAIGYGSYCDASSEARIGNTSTVSIGGYVGWTNISDGRYKRNIKNNVPGLDFINQLKPVTYNLDIKGINNHISEVIFANKSAGGKTIPAPVWDEKSVTAKEQIVYSGFIAQDVEALAKKLGYNFSGVDAPQDDKGFYGLRYAEFVVPLVKAVQELSKANDEKDSAINSLQNQINDLKAMMISNNQSSNSYVSNIKLQTLNTFLKQNIPNPFASTTIINYNLPQKFTSAQIIITDKNGKALKQVNLTQGGTGSININAGAFSSGTYNYTLYVDGKLISSKQLIVTK